MGETEPPPAPEAPDAEQGWRIWLPATVRPAPPMISHLHVTQVWQTLDPVTVPKGSRTLAVVRATSVRVWLRRPWFSAGEGEVLGLVLWPPGLFAGGAGHDDRHVTLPDAAFLDEDLGPGGAWVTRWARDALNAEPVDAAHAGPFVDPTMVRRPEGQVPLAYMPIPVQGPAEAGTGEQSAYLAVALQTYPARFDPQTELWYVDIVLRTDPLPMPRLRLGLVRYQPNAREDGTPPEGEEPVRLRVSTPVREWIRPQPGRRVEVTCTAGADGLTRVVVVVTGASAAPGRSREESGPGMTVEVVRHAAAAADRPALEEPAWDVDGMEATCSAWVPSEPPWGRAPGGSRAGVVQSLPGGAGWSWTTLFVIRGRLDAEGWRHAVVVREADRTRSAKGDGRALDETGPRFAARIELADP